MEYAKAVELERLAQAREIEGREIR